MKMTEQVGSWLPPRSLQNTETEEETHMARLTGPGQDGSVAHEITRGIGTQNALSFELLDDIWSNTTVPLWSPHISEGPNLGPAAKRHSGPFHILAFRLYQHRIHHIAISLCEQPLILHIGHKYHTHIHNQCTHLPKRNEGMGSKDKPV